MLKDKMINGLVDKWGIEKFIKILGLGIFGGGFIMLLAEPMIPNKPENIKEGE